jgi:hypothetical protein
VRWNVWKADTPGIPGTSWTDLTGTWSEWLDPVSDGVITLNTFFSGGTTLRDLMAASPPAGIQPGDEFLLAVVGYDEAGNSQPQFSGNLASAAVLTGQGINYNRWVVPDADMSLGLDTRVQPLLWHNATDAGNILLVDGDERVFGAASRIPLPPEGCTRVEGQFTVEVGLPSDLSGAVGAVVGYEILEDGVLVMQGRRDGVGAVETFVFPEDILAGVDAMTPNPTAFLNTPFDGNTPRDCDGDGTDDKDRLGDEGRVDVEPPYRRRDVEYQIRFSAGLDLGGGDYVFDSTPATVEFTVIAGSGASKATDQAIKQFKRE